MYHYQYYCIHNLDEKRKNHMNLLFEKYHFDLNKITWLNQPNKDNISNELVEKCIIQDISCTNGIWIHPNDLRIMKGKVVCSYKHYLAYQDIIENNFDYGIIMEDNVSFTGPIYDLVDIYINQLNEKYPDWDICFDNKNIPYIEQETSEECFVYPKSNEITKQCHGGGRCACFYIITKKCAKLLYDNWIPFNNAPDWWMNDLFRKFDIKSYWIHPSYVYQPPHQSTAN